MIGVDVCLGNAADHHGWFGENVKRNFFLIQLANNVFHSFLQEHEYLWEKS
jgi:hypothetical protein